mmetsp:Transcript_9376/g.19804  ORF Transcript_9376/g.19804 Transcript_9376/m.19804 type:complete len:85 (+) Transcript_9376:470-724(+)
MGPPCNPEVEWTVYNGALYCNYMSSVTSKFKADIDNMIADAEARWTEYYGDLHAGPFNVGCMADCFKTTCSCMKDCGYCGSSSA